MQPAPKIISLSMKEGNPNLNSLYYISSSFNLDPKNWLAKSYWAKNKEAATYLVILQPTTQ